MQSFLCGVLGGAVGCYGGLWPIKYFHGFGSQIFKKLPGVSGSIGSKPVLIKGLGLGRS